MPEFDNVAIAQLLDTTGDLLELAGADKFRFLSYHKAAAAIRAWPEQLSVLAEQGRLTDVPGVGKKLAVAIQQILSSGTFTEYEEAVAAYPPSLAEVMKVQSVGPVRARILFDQLSIGSVADLEKALAGGRLSEIPSFKERTVANIAAGVDMYLRTHQRTMLMDALPLAEHVVEALRALPSVDRAEPAGSLRRMQETVGDIDILASSADPAAAMAAVRDLPIVARVLGSGESKTSVLTTAGLQVDVRVVSPGQFGAALQYFTGDKQHNIALREIAKKRHLKVNEYGVFRVDAKGKEIERLGGATEDEVYSLLGMDTPPPEIRQSVGEIEAALEHRLPRLLELGEVRADVHLHTNSTDSRSSLEDNRAKAAELGYEYLAVTDHAFNLRMVKGLDVDQLREQWARVDELNKLPGPYILKGVELNIGEDGSLDYADDVLAEFDFCIASLHSGWNDPQDVATARLLKAMDSPYTDVIGHPTGRIIGRREPISLDMEAVLAKAAETGTIMEINAYPDRLDLSDVNLRLARKHGVRFSLGTDAHHCEQMGYMRYGVGDARRGWVTADEVLNAQPLKVARGWFKRNRPH
jgi:DNA polymerase (family 10)